MLEDDKPQSAEKPCSGIRDFPNPLIQTEKKLLTDLLSVIETADFRADSIEHHRIVFVKGPGESFIHAAARLFHQPHHQCLQVVNPIGLF